ncbi:MAG TPA: mevalonate kinase [Nitrosopumilaceae archaeon]|nr:mevalonate kinase [Nitrosopumilaceae archaeon]
MKSIASAPGKVILFGEHFVVYGTKAILCSIDKRIRVTSQIIEDKVIRIRSGVGKAEADINLDSISDESKTEIMKPFFYIANQALRRFKKNTGVEIVIESEIPPGIGLGSSSASCVAVSASVMGLFQKLSREEILKIAIDAERTMFENTSGADCSVCTFGGLMQYDIKNRSSKINSKANFDLVIANSKHPHITSEVVSKVRQFKEKNGELFSSMYQQESSIIQKALVALEKNDIQTLGLLMSENQMLLEKMGVSTDKLDLLINEAKKTAWGAKITGAGGGGCIIALADKSNLDETLMNLKKYGDSFSAKIDYKGLLDTF